MSKALRFNDDAMRADLCHVFLSMDDGQKYAFVGYMYGLQSLPFYLEFDQQLVGTAAKFKFVEPDGLLTSSRDHSFVVPDQEVRIYHGSQC